MIKALILDFGGVIMRTEDYQPRHAWDERLGLAIGSVERAVHHSDLWVQAQLGRISEQAYWKGVAELLYMRGEDVRALRRDYFEGDRLNYRLLATLRELRASGITTAILTNEAPAFEARLRELDLLPLFDRVFISALIGVMKPDPTAFRIALRELHVAPAHAVFVDAARANVHSAREVGLNTILFRSDTDLRAELAPFLCE
jgi:epoxide hydrolase-like predicted phosphatase